MLTHLFRIVKYGTSYAIATGFFPKRIKKDVLLLYSFVRIPDNIVDNITWWKNLNTHYKQAKKELELLQQSRTKAYEDNDITNITWWEYISLFRNNNIPFQYSIDFFKAMINDCSIHRYKSYEQLEWYMYWSASVVWLMMCHIIGFTHKKDEKKAKEFATELWNAMQLTNFLRDVREDYEDLNRIYMPLDILKRYWLSHDDVALFITWKYQDDIILDIKKEARKMYMEYMISHCRKMYISSLNWLQYLNPEWRRAVKIAALLYESILDKIERNKYDVFTKSARTNISDKSKILIQIFK